MSTYLECLHAQNRARHTSADWRECARKWREYVIVPGAGSKFRNDLAAKNAEICDHIADAIEKETRKKGKS